MYIPEDIVVSFNDHPNLKKVKLNTCDISSDQLRAFKISQLEEVNIECFSHFTDWKLFTTNNPNIKSLTLDGVPLTPEDLKLIVSNLKHLEEFQVKRNYGDARFQHAELRLILENCKIRSLDQFMLIIL